MESFIIIVLTSTVISAIISGLISSRMKGKELEVKLKLEEKNKWIENISQAHKDYMENTTECMNSLIRDFVEDRIDDRAPEGSEFKFNSNIKAQNTLIFFMYQSEYVLSDIQETVDMMTENTSELEARNNDNTKSMRDAKGIQEVSRMLTETEEIIQENNKSFSKKLGTMIRKEKKEMTFEIIKSSLIGNIFFRK